MHRYFLITGNVQLVNNQSGSGKTGLLLVQQDNTGARQFTGFGAGNSGNIQLDPAPGSVTRLQWHIMPDNTIFWTSSYKGISPIVAAMIFG